MTADVAVHRELVHYQPPGHAQTLFSNRRRLLVFGAAGRYAVFFYGRWWTVLTASWLHGGFLHILFNMMWLRSLAPDTAEAAGSCA